ncbi:putative protease [Amphibacillus marinus]|uniref:Putative protease n=1 Tax=Amphibacillus marinus TaxID=872970 RepID=A0A1H8L6G0_9BACI|nr:U32 family peptidase [Amphibacillus marinus]SEO00671.1 putative protease [Amphibacillus marinus]
MPRYFNEREIELLAPAGNLDVFKQVVLANCDAIYIGGQYLNMRMMRKGFNFSNNDIVEAVKRAHHYEKKVYVTLNNLLHDNEINLASDYLQFLDRANVDGIIVQDLAVVKLCQDLALSIDIHASVMMNVHNSDYVRALQAEGVTRVVLSREMDLQTAKYIQRETDIETEYFMHGDMCTVNGANCYFSSTIWGNSSNRGRCFKPCRWAYRAKKDGQVYPTEYPLAARDMYMYEHIPELIEARVTSFKIEGRMREADFIINLVNTYGDAIDRYIKEPIAFNRKEQAEQLVNNRKRDFSTAYAFGKPGLTFINQRYEGTGKFYSTGKMFSTPTEEPKLTDYLINTFTASFQPSLTNKGQTKQLTVKVNNIEQAKLAIDLGVDRIYLAGDVLEPDQPFTIYQIQEIITAKNATEVYFALPQMVTQGQVDQIDHFLTRYGQLFDGLLVGNLGSIFKYGKHFSIVADFNTNIYNHQAALFYQKLGVNRITASIESKSDQLSQFMSQSPLPVELIAHGPLKMMYLDLDLYENTEVLTPIDTCNNQYVSNSVLTLLTDKGENPIYRDQYQKNHLYSMKSICLLPVLAQLQVNNLTALRIEGQTYSIHQLKAIIQAYQAAIIAPHRAKQLFAQLEADPAGYTLGSLSYQYQRS